MIYIDKEQVKQNLSNFYKTFGHNEVEIDFFVDLYEECGMAIERYLTNIKNNQTIKGTETFRKYNLAAFKSHGATYKIEDELLNNSNSSALGLTGSLSERLSTWDSFSNKQKAAFLTYAGKYIQLTAKRVFDKTEPEIIDLDLYDLSKNTLIPNKDYFLLDNKIFLIGEYAKPSATNSYLVAVNIFVDYNTPYQLIGSRIGVGYSESISKPEYKDFIQMITYVLTKGPTIKNLRDAFNILAGWENSDIVDRVSATGVRKAMWMNPATAVLTPFDFLVTIPASVANTVGLDAEGGLVPKEDRIDIFKEFLNIIKPTDTNYILALSEYIVELLQQSDIIDLKNTIRLDDNNTIADNTAMRFSKIKASISELFSHNSPSKQLAYDSAMNFDDGKTYDADTEIPSELGNNYGDIVSVRHIKYPEFPTYFTAARNISTGIVAITYVDSAESVAGYEIYRNDTVISTQPFYGDLRTVSFSDAGINSLPSGQYNYYAKSYYISGAETKRSRPSKIITITK